MHALLFLLESVLLLTKFKIFLERWNKAKIKYKYYIQIYTLFKWKIEVIPWSCNRTEKTLSLLYI